MDMGDAWDMGDTRAHMGNAWEMHRRGVGDAWEMHGRHMGDTWETHGEFPQGEFRGGGGAVGCRLEAR